MTQLVVYNKNNTLFQNTENYFLNAIIGKEEQFVKLKEIGSIDPHCIPLSLQLCC
jgi:hypothetical protein